MKNNKIKYAIIICSLILIFIIIYVILNYFYQKENKESFEDLKNYEVNEYIVNEISDETMARIYFNEYIHNMFHNTQEAYESLDKEYRDKKFGSYDNYVSYVNNLEDLNPKMIKYYIITKKGFTIFGIYDNNELFYAFKTNGVLQYSVYLDDYTVEI